MNAQPTTHDDALIAALDASPDFTTVTDGAHLAELLGVQVPSDATLAVLNTPALASAIERGIVAADTLRRIVPDDVQIEEVNYGTEQRTRGVFLYQDGVDQVAMSFVDGTHEIAVHIDSDDPDEEFSGFITPAEMFDLVKRYYRYSPPPPGRPPPTGWAPEPTPHERTPP
jgi:hypothetical protein